MLAAGDALACPYPYQTYEGAKGNLLSACVQRSAESGGADYAGVDFGACAPDAAAPAGEQSGDPSYAEAGLFAGLDDADATQAVPLSFTRVDGGFESCYEPAVNVQTAASNSVPVIVNRSVEAHIRYFQGRGRKHFVKWLGRTGEYMTLLQSILRENSLPEDLFYLAVIESGLNPKAKSRARAVGMWQFIRGTAIRYGLRVDWWIDERMDP